MLSILTPMNFWHRVSRSIDPSNFVAAPGLWAEINSSGNLVNITTATPGKRNAMVLNAASENKYESHDIEVGRIATCESFGVRFTVDGAGHTGTIVAGDELVVDCATGYEGLLKAKGQAAAGTYEVVAKCESVDNTADTLTAVTVSPYYVTV